MTRKMAPLLALFALAFAVGPATAGHLVEVGVSRMQFDPQQIRIKPGDTVKWSNQEKRSNHSIRFEAEDLEESDRIFPGESWQHTFDKPGTYRYRCGPHPEMTGVVEVSE